MLIASSIRPPSRSNQDVPCGCPLTSIGEKMIEPGRRKGLFSQSDMPPVAARDRNGTKSVAIAVNLPQKPDASVMQPVGAAISRERRSVMLATATSVSAFTSRALLFAVLMLPWAATPAPAAEPIKIGLSMALTGSLAPIGKQLLVGLEIWRDDLNAKGGLLGRPVELIHYDDQSNANLVPGIYTKLLSIDKVDLLLGPTLIPLTQVALHVVF
jgi:Periplasmic binding protein